MSEPSRQQNPVTEKTTLRNSLAIDPISITDKALLRFFESTLDPVIVVDTEGTVAFLNEGFGRALGVEPVDLLQKSVNRLIDRQRNVEFFRNLAELGKPREQGSTGASATIAIEGRHGAEQTLEFSMTALDASGGPLIVCLGRRLHSDRQSLAREERLNEAQRIAQIGNWEWDILSNSDWWSDELYRMLEVDPGKKQPTFEFFQSLVHPGDLDRLQRETRESLETDKRFSTDVRVVLPSGKEKVLHSQGVVQRDADGQPAKMYGTLQDVTHRTRVEAALRKSETRYRDAQRIAQIGNFEWNIATGKSWWSDELYKIIGAEPGAVEPCFESFLACIHPDDHAIAIANQKDTSTRGKERDPQAYRLIMPDGTEKVVEMIIDMRCDENGNPHIASGTIRDITERHILETRLRESEARYSSTVDLAAIGITHVDIGGRFIWANQHCCDMLGYSVDQLLDMTVDDVSHPEDVGKSDRGRARMHAGETESLVIEKRYMRQDGAVIWVRITSAVRRSDRGLPIYDIAIVEDISDRRNAEQRIQFLATHDEMTGLPNRTTFGELVTHAIDSAASHDRKCAVLFIDLDRFKIVNDSLGHDAGDLLLKEMTQRIGACVQKPNVLARFGGDEFVVLLEELESRRDAEEVSRKVLSAVLQPLQILGQEFRVTASIGIAMFPEDAQDTRALLKHADSAMYLAKDEGKNNFQFYSPDSSPLSVENLVLETQLGHALERDEFTVHYQARVDVDTGEIRGAEALLRWWNHDLGTVAPSQFIPIAEDSGLIVPIGKWVLKAACKQNIEWQRRGLPGIVMSVNLSPRQFKDPGLLSDIAEVLESTGLAPELLELEITESMITHVEQAAERLNEIKRLGVLLAIDDFGTGYSSLSQLKRFPIDTLKVDRSFIRDIPHNPEDEAITEAIISLGKTLGVTVVAEGVETEIQHRFLQEHGCDQFQGYYFHRPCPPESFAQLLRSRLTT